MELTVCSVDGPPALLEALGEPGGAPADRHHVLLNLSPFSAITLSGRERKVAGIEPAGESFAFAYPAMFAPDGPGATAKSRAVAITEAAAAAAARSAAAQGAAAGSAPPEASDGVTVRVSVDGQTTPPVMRQSADSQPGDGDGRQVPHPSATLCVRGRGNVEMTLPYPTPRRRRPPSWSPPAASCSAAASCTSIATATCASRVSRSAARSPEITRDHPRLGDLCQPPLAITLPEPGEADEHDSHHACSGRTEEAGAKSGFSYRAGQRSPLDLRLNGPHVLSPWATLKLHKAGRFLSPPPLFLSPGRSMS